MGGNPVEGGPGHTASCVLDCRYAWVTDNGNIRVIDLTNPDAPVTMGSFPTPAGGDVVTHDVQVDGNGLAWVVGFGGTAGYQLPAGYDGTGLGQLVAKTGPRGVQYVLRGTRPGRRWEPERLHPPQLPPPGERRRGVRHGGGLHAPGMQGSGLLPVVVPAGGDSPTGGDLRPRDDWTTQLLAETANPAVVCSAHYFDFRRNVVAQGWYEQGVRLLDVHDPADIRQIGYFVPATSVTWAAYFPPTDPVGEVIYSIDAARGIDVLEFDRPDRGPLSIRGGECQGKGSKACAEETAPSLIAPIRPAWLGSAPVVGAPTATFGFACRTSLSA
jgi:hypothetical protein